MNKLSKALQSFRRIESSDLERCHAVTSKPSMLQQSKHPSRGHLIACLLTARCVA
jgi:hypothetical protein